MQKKILIIITILVLSFLGISTIFLSRKKLKVDLIEEFKINMYDEVYNADCIKLVTNGEVVTNKEILDTITLGIKEVNITIKDYFKKEYNYLCKYKVVDEEKPKISYNDNLTTTEGTKIDLLKDVITTDNSKENITTQVLGEYDFNKAGIYNLQYAAKDSSGNEEIVDFTLTVKEKPKTATVQNKEGAKVNTEPTYFETSKGFKGVIQSGITYIDGTLIANKTYALPSSYNPGGLTKETKTNADIMINDAKTLGLKIWIQSGFRSFETQYALYNRYLSRDGVEKADTYSARAGHSEHQSGLAFDVNQINSTFDDTPEAKWLHENCYKYGFILRYPKGKTNETGYKYESWHFRYVGEELATKLYNNGEWITLEDYFGITSAYNY